MAPVLWNVVKSIQGRYSIWPADRLLPPGWMSDGFRGIKDECGAYVGAAGLTPVPVAVRDRPQPEIITPTAVRNARCGDRLDVLLASVARDHPDYTALRCEGTEVTYRELFSVAEQVAVELRARGATGGDFVGVVVGRSAEAVAAILGVVLSGAAYVPMDPDAPRARLRQIAQQSAMRLVTGLVDNAMADDLGLVRVPMPRAESAARFDVAPSAPEDPAYVIFTSGSTGVPKGVVVPHRAVVNSTNARFAVFPLYPMNYLMLAPLTFDAAVAGVFFTLAAGGTLVLPTNSEVRDPGLLGELVIRQRISHLDGVPSQYAAVLEYAASALKELACVIVAGEALPQGLARKHMVRLPGVPLFNEYGPTEGTVWSTVHQCTLADGGPLAPIGSAVDGVEVAVWDENLRPVDPGAVGEIVISGAQLADGYLGRPDLTALRFLPHPERAGERVYLTGDLGRVDESGSLVYCGRIGHMVKVRGFRVELGEVEGWLRTAPDVVDAVVLPERMAGTIRLVAVVVMASGTTLNRSGLRSTLADRLPHYMVPSEWRAIDQMPLTKSGKRDRVAAAAVAGVQSETEGLPMPDPTVG